MPRNKQKRCRKCGKPLSIYNKTRECFSHSTRGSGLTTAEWFNGAAMGQGNPGDAARQTQIQYNGK